ncbi:MAG: hypothetical protein LBJ32_01470, partial [Oscillospiraceae bacterium]|nr:hypothetical protein [Oscillospiraceae bacterium]
RLIKEKENQEAAERLRKLKEDQEAEEARHLIKENQEEKLQQEMEETQILAEAQELFEDLETQNFRRKSMISGAGTNEEVMLNFIIFFLKAVCLAKEFLKILQRRLNFEHYESSKKITVIDTNANLDLNYLVPSELEPSAEDQWREFTREMLEKALGDLKQFFIFFAVILNVLVKTFKLNFFGGDKNGCERINRGYEPILIVTEYTCKSLESTSIMTENFGRKKVDDFKYILEKVYEKKTLDCLNNLEKILCNLKTNDNILVKNVVDILLFFYERSGFIIYNYW